MSDTALLKWLGTAALTEQETELVLQKLASCDLNSIQLIETLTREDWADVLPTPIGLRLRLHKAAGTIQLRHTIERENGIIQAKRTSLERLKAKNNALSDELKRIDKLSSAISEDVIFQTTELQRSRGKLATAQNVRDQISKQLQEAVDACRVLQNEIDSERAQYNTAIAAKEAAIKKLVTQDRVSQIAVPTLEPTVVPAKKPSVKKAKKYTEQLWYVGGASREDCEAQLMQNKCTVGQFLVRDGSNAATSPFSVGCAFTMVFSLSVRVPGKGGKGEVKHFRCLQQSNGKLQLGQKVPDSYMADSIDELVSYYMNVGLKDGGTTLSEAPPRLRKVVPTFTLDENGNVISV